MALAFIIMAIIIYFVVLKVYKNKTRTHAYPFTNPMPRATKPLSDKEKLDNFLLDDLIFNIELHKQKEQGRVVVYHNSIQ